jgi:hypothetical protein
MEGDAMPRRVSCFPHLDEAFCDAANIALRETDGAAVDSVASLLAQSLRHMYPSVEVHRQEPLARFHDEDVWYVYRDGKPIAAETG